MPAPEFKQTGLNAWFWCFSAYWRLWLVLFKIRFLGFSWLREQVELQASDKNCTETNVNNKASQETVLLALHEAVRLAARLPMPTADCLPKSIVLVNMLVARGWQARAVIGVTNVGQQFASHAWVEVRLEKVWQMIGEPESVAREFTQI